LLWQRKLRLWVVAHLHEPVSAPTLTGHGDLFQFPYNYYSLMIANVQQFCIILFVGVGGFLVVDV